MARVGARPVDNELELDALITMLRFAREFVLGFASVAHPDLRDRLIGLVREALPARRIDVVAVRPDPRHRLIDQLSADEDEAAGARDALFVTGLEEVVDLGDGRRADIDLLNLHRDSLAERLPYPVVFWAPDFAIRQVARSAPDLWSWRSSMYRFSGDPDDIAATAARLAVDWSAEVHEKRVTERTLRHLLDELDRAEHDVPALRADLDARLGSALYAAGRCNDAQAHYDHALPTYRQLGSRLGEANTLQALGDLARTQDRYDDAQAHYDHALPTYRQLGDRLGEANTLQALGDLARTQGHYDDAQALLDEALAMQRQLGAGVNEANALHSLGQLAQARGRLPEAAEAFEEAARLYRKLGFVADDVRARAQTLRADA